jgi:hypothetical protein
MGEEKIPFFSPLHAFFQSLTSFNSQPCINGVIHSNRHHARGFKYTNLLKKEERKR